MAAANLARSAQVPETAGGQSQAGTFTPGYSSEPCSLEGRRPVIPCIRMTPAGARQKLLPTVRKSRP